MLRPLLAYDPIRVSAEENALNDLEGIKTPYATNFRRFYQAALTAATFTKVPSIDRAARALSQRSEVITNSGNTIYRAAFMNLIQTKFSKNAELIKDVAREVLVKSAPGSSERISAALSLARAGETSKEITDALSQAYLNTKLSSDQRKEIVAVSARVATTPADKDKIISLLGNTDQVLRSAAYTAVGSMTLSEANLPTISKLLLNPAVNIRGNAVRALSRVPGEKAILIMAGMIKDKDIDVALTATTHVGSYMDYDFDPALIKNKLVVSNHLSYLDVLCFSSLFPASYVTSVEIRETPVLGILCELCGCVFTERRRKFRTMDCHEQEIQRMEKTLSSGINLVLFPEGTSTTGEEILPFKTSLLEVSGIFLPMALKYNSPAVPWYGEMTFIPHFWVLCGQEGLICRMALGRPHIPEQDEGRKVTGLRLFTEVKELHARCNF